MLTSLYLIFAVSGTAGLIYELVWSRYLALYVGHGAYAQVLVIGIYLGGLALGSLLVAGLSRRLRRPLLVYAGAEAALAAAGIGFHALFQGVSAFSYDALFPALDGGALTAAKWTAAGLMIAPQAVLLGTTFPLMSAAAVRRRPERAGRIVANLYFTNSLGGAVGVLVAGFLLVAVVGLPGTLAAAAGLNLVAAVGAILARGRRRSGDARRAGDRRRPPAAPAAATADAGLEPRDPGFPTGLWRLFLGVSFLTAMASFAYEIGWIRMLSMVLGSATHSFEIMLSAFILGLALGSLAVRRRADDVASPMETLGWIQWAMGLAAVATLPVYVASYDVMGRLVDALDASGGGYALFALARYGIALSVMLPATLLAGATLPLITASLYRAGVGERAFGWVYGLNTLGSVVGVAAAGLVLLPVLGLEGLVLAGAALDTGLGLALLWLSRRPTGRGAEGDEAPEPTPPTLLGWGTGAWVTLGAGVVAVGVFAWTGWGARIDPALLTSGVFRHGDVADPYTHDVLYYEDGRTASIGAYYDAVHDLVVLSTNGKPDASMTPRWIRAARERVDPTPIDRQDEATQLLSGMVPLAHAPDAETVAVIGHGSGVSSHFLLGSPAIETLTTVEIEPRMIDGSRIFHPANERAFDDPRARIAIDDARTWFAHDERRFDLIVSEPSNPWVTGVSSLFTEQFYRRIRRSLTDDGVFAQWLQLYEIDDGLVVSVLAALDRAFPTYRAYLISYSDLMVVATPGAELPEPDWSVFELPGVAGEIRHVTPFRPAHLDATRVFDRATVAPLVQGWRRPNSDYHPVLDVGAERARFLRRTARGVYGMAADRFSVSAALAGRRQGVGTYAPPPIAVFPPMRGAMTAAWLRAAIRSGTGEEPPDGVPATIPRALDRYRRLRRTLDQERPAGRWPGWLALADSVDADLHRGTAGTPDTAFYGELRRFLADADPPDAVRAGVEFLHGAAAFRWPEAAEASRVLVPAVAAGRLPGFDAAHLLDAAVVARLAVADVEGARAALELLSDRTGRRPGDFRLRLLRARVRAEEEGSPGPHPTSSTPFTPF